MKFSTIKEACELWVERDMNQVPTSVVEKLMQDSDYTDIREITPPAKCDRVTLFSGDYDGVTGEIVEHLGNTEYLVKLDDSEDDEPVEACEDEFEVQHDDALPMWGTMWAFKDNCDKEWLCENLQKVADCGFRIFESEDYEYLIGIDGAGYDFYEAHFCPLYKARGLHWHKENEEASGNE